MDNDGLSRRTLIKVTAGGSVVALAGCLGGDGGGAGDDGGNEGDDVEEVELGEGEITLEFSAWGQGVERQTVESMLSSYAEQNDQVAVEFQHVPQDYADRLRTQFGAGEEPDAFYIGLENVGEFEDVLVNLEPELSQELIDDLDDAVLEAVYPREGLPFIPKDFQYGALIHNTEVLANAGYDEFPEHWNEFRSMLEAIDEGGEVDYPIVDWDPYFMVFAFMSANGGQVMNEERTECVIDSEANIEALEFLQGLREDGLLGLGNEVAADAEHAILGEQQTAMIFGGGWIIAEIGGDYEEMDEIMDIAVPPYQEGEEPGTLILTAGYAVSQNSDYIDESIDLVQYLMGDGIMPWLETGIALSIRESHREEVELYQEDERYQRWFEMSEYPRHTAQEYGPKTQEILSTINPQIQGIYQGEVEPADAVATIEEEVNNNILN